MVNRQARSVARVNVHCDINMIRRIKGAVEDSLFFICQEAATFHSKCDSPVLLPNFLFQIGKYHHKK